MGITRDEHMVRVDGAEVVVTGRTGLVSATWSLLIDGREVASRLLVAGRAVLAGPLPGGGTVEASVDQDMFGPTRVEVRHGGQLVARFSGFVLERGPSRSVGHPPCDCIPAQAATLGLGRAPSPPEVPRSSPGPVFARLEPALRLWTGPS